MDEQEVWWLIRAVFWSILLFVAIKIGTAVILRDLGSGLGVNCLPSLRRRLSRLPQYLGQAVQAAVSQTRQPFN